MVGELDAVGVDVHDDVDGDDDRHRDNFSDSVKKPEVVCSYLKRGRNIIFRD